MRPVRPVQLCPLGCSAASRMAPFRYRQRASFHWPCERGTWTPPNQVGPHRCHAPARRPDPATGRLGRPAAGLRRRPYPGRTRHAPPLQPRAGAASPHDKATPSVRVVPLRG
ncbi:unnamed protein product [Urochloa humidicola]